MWFINLNLYLFIWEKMLELVLRLFFLICSPLTKVFKKGFQKLQQSKREIKKKKKKQAGHKITLFKD